MDATLTSTVVAEVRQMLAAGQSKPALRKAKDNYKQQGTSDSERLLMDAYLGRVEALAGAGLVIEARALLGQAWQEHLEAAAAQRCRVAGLGVRLGEACYLGRALSANDLSDPERTELDALVRAELCDPGGLARSEDIPTDHPVRRAAMAVAEALEAVTRGPVSDEQVALRDVSRSSPLASWKPLIRAITALYRGDEASCERLLALVEAGSAPARLVPALRHLLGKSRNDDRLTPQAAVLCGVVKGSSQDPLCAALNALDAAFPNPDIHMVEMAIRRAVSACETHRPDLVDHLRQRISVKAASRNRSVRRVRKALGKPALKDARFWRLFARSIEVVRGNPVEACLYWDRFRVHAAHEGWFSAESEEAAVVYLHMAELLDDLPLEILRQAQRMLADQFRGVIQYYKDQPATIRVLEPVPGAGPDLYFTSPAACYRRAAALTPRAEIFEKWLAWCERAEPEAKAAEEAAHAWHESLPADVRPLLYLMHSAEQRGAHRKAMDYLEKAEALDAVNTQVRTARLRLSAQFMIRHLKAGQWQLAEKDLAGLESSKQTDDVQRHDAVRLLRAMLQLEAGQATRAAAECEQAGRELNSALAAELLVAAVHDACGSRQDLTAVAALVTQDRPPPLEQVSAGVGRAQALAEKIALRLVVPPAWHRSLVKQLDDGQSRLEAPDLLALAQVAVGQKSAQLAYAAAGSGLCLDAPLLCHGQLLLIRAQAMPTSASQRRFDCLRAALTLARRGRDERLTEQVMRLLRRCIGPWNEGQDWWAQPLAQADLLATLKKEQRSKRYPRGTQNRPVFGGNDHFDLFNFGAPTTDRRASEKSARRSGPQPADIDFEPTFDVALRDLERMFDGGVGPELAPLLMELITKYVGPDGELPDLEDLPELDPDLAERIADVLSNAEHDTGAYVAPVRRPHRKRR